MRPLFFRSIAAIAWLCVVAASVSAQEIWLSPHAPGPFPGLVDWSDIFEPGAPWQTAASHVKMLLLAEGSYERFSDAEITKIATFMTQHGAMLGVGYGGVARVPGAACGGTEGYSVPQVIEALAARLSRLNVPIGYVETDGAVSFGHYATNPQACRLPIDQVAQRTAATLQGFIKYYPNAIYGDIEGSDLTNQPDWQQNFGTFRQLLEQAIGHRLENLDVDVSWPLPSWPRELAQLARYAQANGLRFGVIYNGDGLDHDDKGWMEHAQRNFERIEGELGIIPDHAFISSWNDNPERFLPETSPTAFSHLVLSYLRPRTRFELDRTAGVIRGRVVDQAGGVPGATVQLQAVGFEPNKLPPEQRISGTVPAKATSAVFAFGVNLRPDIAGDNDLLLGDFVYSESGTGSARQVFSVPSRVAQGRDTRPGGIEKAEVLAVAGQPLVRLVVHANQSYHFNSPRFAVDGGAPFSLSGRIASATSLGMFGAIDIVWFDAEGHDKWRSSLRVDPTFTTVTQVVADNDGRFTLTPAASAPSGGLRLFYPGSDKLRAAYADLSSR